MIMAVSVFTRFTNLRNALNVNNLSAIGSALNIKQHSNVTPRSYVTISTGSDSLLDENADAKPKKKMSKAMKMYLKRATEYKKLMERELVQYELGKRHLANMMGEDPEQFTQEDIDRSIKYLLPSGLYDWRARPLMIHPSEIFESKKEAEFDESGRPHHYLFYTCRPNYYEILHNIADSIYHLNEAEDTMTAGKQAPSAQDKINLTGSAWLSKEDIESKILETISPEQYDYLIKSFNRLASHPISGLKSEFIMNYRKQLERLFDKLQLPPFEYDSNDRPFITVPDCMRKSSRGAVKVIGNGTGKITINGKDILCFENIQCREQVRF